MKIKSTKSLKRRRRARIFVLVFLTLLTAGFVWFFIELDTRLMPAVVDIASQNVKNRITLMVNTSVRHLTEERSISSKDFLLPEFDGGGKLTSLSVNTLLVNDICAGLSNSLTVSMSDVLEQDVSIPVGAILGIKSLANTGPGLPISVMPVGDACVDYETSFLSEGINQINFQIWLNIQINLRIANPVISHDFEVSRKIPLVNTIIPGDVPPSYFNIQ